MVIIENKKYCYIFNYKIYCDFSYYDENYFFPKQFKVI